MDESLAQEYLRELHVVRQVPKHTLDAYENNLKVKSDIAGFVIPIGATMNMDGTALYEASAALFIANLSGIDLDIGQQIIVFFTAHE